mmetsp:Transcript_34275/g.80931  ORF Transcript_34275/g.80931 Transcript_34275/m.80931 type:complete len:335 (+) Transcript_34275:952-1956(+)
MSVITSAVPKPPDRIRNIVAVPGVVRSLVQWHRHNLDAGVVEGSNDRRSDNPVVRDVVVVQKSQRPRDARLCDRRRLGGSEVPELGKALQAAAVRHLRIEHRVHGHLLRELAIVHVLAGRCEHAHDHLAQILGVQNPTAVEDNQPRVQVRRRLVCHHRAALRIGSERQEGRGRERLHAVRDVERPSQERVLDVLDRLVGAQDDAVVGRVLPMAGKLLELHLCDVLAGLAAAVFVGVVTRIFDVARGVEVRGGEREGAGGARPAEELVDDLVRAGAARCRHAAKRVPTGGTEVHRLAGGAVHSRRALPIPTVRELPVGETGQGRRGDHAEGPNEG